MHHWRQLLTDELKEVRGLPISAACFVLDALLLYAARDGMLRAHPRGNPQSTYHVEHIDSLVSHLAALYNVVAVVHRHSTLEVRQVERTVSDPFIQFPRTLWQTQDADSDHAPLLYGPYVVYASLDGNWYRVEYDKRRREEDSRSNMKQLIRIPFKVGWKLVTIKMANWRYYVVVLRNPRTHLLEEFFLFAGGGGDSLPRPFLVAACIDCGTHATFLCGSCLDTAFCDDHAQRPSCKTCKKQ